MERRDDLVEHVRKLEKDLAEQKRKLARLRREVPPQEIPDYVFQGSSGEEVRLSQLFGDRHELIMVHNMGSDCAFCTLWADGFNGIYPHLENRAAFAMNSPDAPAVQRAFAADRGWGFKLVSCQGTRFRQDIHYAKGIDDYWPGVSVFTRDADGKIFHVSDSAFGPGDNFCVAWDLLDLLPGGYEDWAPQFHYFSTNKE